MSEKEIQGPYSGKPSTPYSPTSEWEASLKPPKTLVVKPDTVIIKIGKALLVLCFFALLIPICLTSYALYSIFLRDYFILIDFDQIFSLVESYIF